MRPLRPHYAQGHGDTAIALALRAAALTPGDSRMVIHAAELLLSCGRADEAAEMLHGAAGDAADPRLLRVLSAAEMVRGRLDAALEAVERALAVAPDIAEFHIHFGHLLWCQGDFAGAARAF